MNCGRVQERLSDYLEGLVGRTLVHPHHRFRRPSGTGAFRLPIPEAEAWGYPRGVPPGRGGGETNGLRLTGKMSRQVAGRDRSPSEADWRPHSGNHAKSVTSSPSVPAATPTPGDLWYLNGNAMRAASG